MNNKFALGLIAGEGCFSANMSKFKTNAFGLQANHSFTLGMSDREHRLLKDLQSLLKIGDIETHQEDCARFHVQRHSEITELIEFIENNRGGGFEKSSKFTSYEIWKDLWIDRDELTKTESGMKEFATRANEVNPDDARRGRSVAEKHSIIEENCREKYPWKSAERLRSELENQDWVYEDVAREWDCTAGTVSKWKTEHGLVQQ